MTLSILDELGVIARSHKIPYHALLELTYGCNLRCVMCYNPTHKAENELTLDQYCDLLDQLAAAGTVQLTLTGGEVLARRDFWDIAEAARDRHFALRIFTNGTRVTPEIAQRFVDLVPLMIEISIYGVTAETHDAVTAIPGSFVKTLEGIRNLKAVGAPVMLKTLLTQFNKHEIEETLQLVDELGVHFKGFDPVVFANHNGDQTPVNLKVPPEEVARLLPFGLECREDPFTGDAEAMCGAGNDFVSITPHGDVYPCLSMRIPMGNVRERPFGDIWSSPDEAEQIVSVRNATWGSLSTCSSCDSRGICQRCPGLAHHEDGDVLGPSSTHCGLTFARVDYEEEVAGAYS